MAGASSTSGSLPLIVSVDDHVVEGPGVWQDRIAAKWRDRAPHVVQERCETMFDPGGAPTYIRGGDGPVTDWWVYEDSWRPIPQVMACAGFPEEELRASPIPFADMRPGCYDPKERLADLDVNHTEASLCFPNYPRFCGQVFLEAADKELALLCVRAYNDWMIEEWCATGPGRLIPLCLVPMWDPHLAADEIRRNAARGCRAVTFSEIPPYLGLPSIHDRDRWWDPFLRACDETGTVVCMHIGSGSKMPVTSDDAPRGVVIALTFANAQASLADWLLSGALARFPNLKIAYSEGQVGWMPYLLERLDKLFVHSRAWAGIDPAVTEPPSTYMSGHVYGCFFDDDTGLAMRDVIGVRQLAFETDYPHQDGTWPNSRAVVERMARQLSAEELYWVVRGNALDMLGLPETSGEREGLASARS
jgi:predicted TIM-barrel fold metal-dependent hydrolase